MAANSLARSTPSSIADQTDVHQYSEQVVAQKQGRESKACPGIQLRRY
jgi:hypothetical protein